MNKTGELVTRKEKELKEINEQIAKAKQDWNNFKELQDSIKETAHLRKDIEEGRVTHQALSIQLKLLEASNSMLQQEREDLQQALNDALLL